MLADSLKEYTIILASGSPRRQELLQQLQIPFTIDIRKIEENYPNNLEAEAITDYLTVLKAKAFPSLKPNDLLITSDTIVWHRNTALGKPKNKEEAVNMLQSLSGKSHCVITSVCFTTTNKQIIVNESTTVKFKKLSNNEIHYYVDTFQPYDKAGAYGIQEWIGLIGITKIEGSYHNVMGLPTRLVYKTLMQFVNY